MPLRAMIRRLLAVLCFGAFVIPALHAQDSLILFKRSAAHGKGGEVELIVRGARPGEPVFLLVDVRRDLDPAHEVEYHAKADADAAGVARFPAATVVSAGAENQTLFVRAFTVRPENEGDRYVRSNVTLLREVPALFLLVDDAAQHGRILRYDPFRATLEPRLERVDADSVLAVADSIPFGARGGTVVQADADDTVAPFPVGERVIDLVSSADQSMLLALTREEVAGGRALLRLRLIEAEAPGRELANLEVLRDGRLVTAWLVCDADSHRALVAERDGAIREIVLGAEPGRGLTILPLSPMLNEELLEVAIRGEQLVVVTQPGAGNGRRATRSRVLVFDLAERLAPLEFELSGVALDFQLVDRPDGAAVFAVLDTGLLEIVPLDASATRPAPLPMAGARFIARTTDGLVFVLQTDAARREASVARVDAATLAVTPLAIDGLGGRISRFGLVGDATRLWLYAIQSTGQSPNETAGASGAEHEDEELCCAEIDPAEGRVTGNVVHRALGGHVRRVKTR